MTFLLFISQFALAQTTHPVENEDPTRSEADKNCPDGVTCPPDPRTQVNVTLTDSSIPNGLSGKAGSSAGKGGEN